MLTVVVRRLLLAVPNVILITVLLFFAVSGLLGSPAALMLGEDANRETIAELNASMGFDRPLIVQYLDWMGRALQGDFGRSYTTQERVADAILPRVLPTLELAFLAILVATLGATVLNSLAVGRRVVQPVIQILSVLGITMPNFMIGISLIFLFSVELGWLPSTGWSPWSDGVIAHFVHILMPVLTLSAFYFGSFSLVYRAEYEAVRRRLYVQVARAKGLSATGVSFKHVLPNSILPVITYIGISLGHLAGGAVVTESVFSVPGLGSLFVNAILGRDFPVMLAVSMFIIVGVVIANLLADLVYTLVNPQIRLD
ncbi:MAG: ABC transporter permease [Alphaproteobacteria bacterium]|nr:ABC transporter permease [Alphaproteobacteria bacterium]